ncbi:MAG: hypothetical protein IKF52_03385 [Clostridia bacterium]|nr:hypothetical protein [Clostridia bacterium]
MEDNNNQEVKKEIEKKKGIKVYHIIIILLVVIIALLGVHIYADNAGYGNIIGLVKGEKKEEKTEKQEEKVEEPKAKEFTDEEVKEACQKYMNIIGKREASFEAMLKELNIKVNDSEYKEELRIVTNVKYSDYKDTLLQYVTEDLFEEQFAKGHNDNGYLCYIDGHGSGIEIKVKSIEKIGDNEYKVQVDYVFEIKTESHSFTCKVAEYNGKCVIAEMSELSNEKASSDTINNTTNNTVSSLDLNSELVQKLDNMLLKYDDSENCYAWQSGFEKVSFYKDTKTTYSTLSNIEKILYVLKNAGTPKSITDETEKNRIVNNASSIQNKEAIVTSIDVYEDIENIAKKMFNTNTSDINWTPILGLGTQLEYIKGNYYVIHGYGGGRGTVEFGYSNLEKAEQDGEYVYLYDKFIWVDEKNENEIKVYTSADKTNEIGTESATSDINTLLNKYDSQLNTYKHTFKKSSDGTYTWISTEKNN